MTWWPTQLAHPRYCPGPAGAPACAYCGKSKEEHPAPELECPGIVMADRYRAMGAALESGPQKAAGRPREG